jgi:DNA repair exonuclease SbcCD nuclease subunit
MGMTPTIIHTADLHLGHQRVPSADTVNDIRKYLFPQLANNADILLIVGDIFDGKVSLNHPDASIIVDLFADLLKICFEYDIIIRIIRGTYSHDNHQLDIFNKIYDKLGIPVDYRVVEEISIEYIERYDIRFLYMPDNLPYSSKADVFDHIKTLFCANNIEDVDYVLLHGEFDHVNFGHTNINAYNCKDFDNICNALVLAGHIHKPHRHRQVIYAGSFNRLAHNEEEAKGFWKIKGTSAEFIENKDSTKFITVDYNDESNLETLLNRHKDLIDHLPSVRKSFIRVLITDTHLKQAIIKYHQANYPNVKLTFKNPLSKGDNKSTFLIDKLKKMQAEILEIPSVKNISSIVCNHLSQRGVNIDINDIEKIINA